MELQLIEAKILSACQIAKSNGWKIKRGTTIDRMKQLCCGLAACGINDKDNPINLYFLTERDFKWGQFETAQFMNGFDSTEKENEFKPTNEYYKLGNKIAKLVVDK